MKERVDHCVAKAIESGLLTKVGRRYRFADITGETVTREAFIVEEVMEGEPPVLLPTNEPPTDRLTMTEVRRLIQRWLEMEDSGGVSN